MPESNLVIERIKGGAYSLLTELVTDSSNKKLFHESQN